MQPPDLKLTAARQSCRTNFASEIKAAKSSRPISEQSRYGRSQAWRFDEDRSLIPSVSEPPVRSAPPANYSTALARSRQLHQYSIGQQRETPRSSGPQVRITNGVAKVDNIRSFLAAKGCTREFRGAWGLIGRGAAVDLTPERLGRHLLWHFFEDAVNLCAAGPSDFFRCVSVRQESARADWISQPKAVLVRQEWLGLWWRWSSRQRRRLSMMPSR